MPLGFDQLIGKGRIVVDREYVRIYDPNDGKESASCAFSSGGHHPVRAYWEGNGIHVVMGGEGHSDQFWKVIGGCNEVQQLL